MNHHHLHPLDDRVEDWKVGEEERMVAEEVEEEKQLRDRLNFLTWPLQFDNSDCEYILEVVLSEELPGIFIEVVSGALVVSTDMRRTSAIATAPEVLEELMHPDLVSIPMTQLETEQTLIAEVKKCNQKQGTRIISLAVAGTVFYMSLMHYKEENSTVPVFNDTKLKRIEFLDFSRRSNDKLLYIWDSRQCIVLSLLNDDNKFDNRIFTAMTNLYLPLGDAAGTIVQDHVLLDILIRMDAHTKIDALVGIIYCHRRSQIVEVFLGPLAISILRLSVPLAARCGILDSKARRILCI